MEKLQIDLNRLGEWAVANAMITNPANQVILGKGLGKR
jgi:hypothetical protein